MNTPQELPIRDIHLPTDPSWWPPAPGWWLLMALVIISIVVLHGWRRRQRLRRLSAINLARQSLLDLQNQYRQQQDGQTTIRELSVLLRRLSISAHPRADAAGLTGEAWLQYLDKPMPEAPFSEGLGRILIDAPYKRHVEAADIAPLFGLCEQWIDVVTKESSGQ